jgi:zinc transport system substrate-binding protein
MNRIVLFILLFSVFLTCKESQPPEHSRIMVATSIYPVYDIAQSIAGGRAAVFFVVPIGANPHTYEPNPSAVKKLQEVNLFIGLFRDFDGWMEKFLTESAAIGYLKEREDNGNPHLWLSVRKAKRLAERIAHYLAERDPQNGVYYRENLQSYLRELDRIDVIIAALFRGVKTKKFIQWHPAWDYLAGDYGLEIVGTIQSGHGDKPSMRKFKNLIDLARRENVRVVVLGLGRQSRTAEILIKEIDGRLVKLDVMGDPGIKERSSYTSLMYHNAKILAGALNE